MKINTVGTPRTQVTIMTELLESLNQADGAARQIAQTRKDPRFLMMADGLHATKMLCTNLVTAGLRFGEREKKVILT